LKWHLASGELGLGGFLTVTLAAVLAVYYFIVGSIPGIGIPPSEFGAVVADRRCYSMGGRVVVASKFMLDRDWWCDGGSTQHSQFKAKAVSLQV
jgi:hypothetical protein